MWKDINLTQFNRFYLNGGAYALKGLWGAVVLLLYGCHLEILGKLEDSRSSRSKLNKTLDFVKIISLKNSNFDLALRKRLFCSAKQPLLPCKTYAFGMQNNRFCKALIYSLLCDSCACEKYLHSYRLFLPIYKKTVA